MTAEVAVMNAQAVALAADSAVSINGTAKTFLSADKIFGLSAWEPVAVMIHGNASFMGVPWETIIKTYRRQLGERCFATVAEYACDFARFIEEDRMDFFPKEVRVKQARSEMKSRLERCLRLINYGIEVGIAKKGGVTLAEIPIYLTGAIEQERAAWSKAELIPGLSRERARELIQEHENDVRVVQKEVFVDLPLTTEAHELASELCGWFLTRMLPDDEAPHSSGVVFAGFGFKEYFPNVVEYIYDGIVGNTLRCREVRSVSVSRARQAEVMAFGQSDMVQAFMDGIDPSFKDEITRSLKAFLVGYSDVVLDAVPGLDEPLRNSMKEQFRRIGEEAFLKYRNSLKNWRRKEYADRTLGVIRALPKDELAVVAESLVSLTSLKRRVSMDASVSPPIDVCVVSKHDGCVWVKKKHYFPLDLNPRFLPRYAHQSKPEELRDRDQIPDSAGDSDVILRRSGERDPDGDRSSPAGDNGGRDT